MQTKKKHGILCDDKAFNKSRINKLEENLADKVIRPQLRTWHAFYFITVTSSYNLSSTDAAPLTHISYSCAQQFSALKYFYLMSPLPPPFFNESRLLVTISAENKKDGLFLFFLLAFLYLRMASICPPSLLFSRLKSSNPFS